MQTIKCQVVALEALTDTVFQVFLKPEKPLHQQAGQYLMMVLDEDDRRPFSIASKPGNELIELHIGAFVAESYAMQVIEHLRRHEHVTIDAPAGQAVLRQQSSNPRILVAGGTGFSYIHALVAELIANQDQQPTYLYWGCRDAAGMYLRQQAEIMAQQHPQLTFIPVFDEAIAGERHGSVIDAVCQDFKTLAPYDIYVAGRFEMARIAKERFLAQGALNNQLIGDAFSYLT